MAIRPRSGPVTRWPAAIALAMTAAVYLAACAGRPAGRPDTAIATSGFPVGTYVKAFVEPTYGPSTLAWTFEPDGRWAEVPLDGAPVGATPIRGRYAVEGDLLTLATDYPPGFGTSRHRWRVEGSNLWTTFESSDFEEDAEWFALLDPTPWTPLK